MRRSAASSANELLDFGRTARGHLDLDRAGRPDRPRWRLEAEQVPADRHVAEREVAVRVRPDEALVEVEACMRLVADLRGEPVMVRVVALQEHAGIRHRLARTVANDSAHDLRRLQL